MNPSDARLLLAKDPDLVGRMIILGLQNGSELWRPFFENGLTQAMDRSENFGVHVLCAAAQHQPELMLGMLEQGWGPGIRAPLDVHDTGHAFRASTLFLSKLDSVKDTATAQKALRCFFEGCSPDTVTAHLLGTQAPSACRPIYNWLNGWLPGESMETYTSLRKSLLEGSKACGVDLENKFTWSISCNNGDGTWGHPISGEHTILSALVGSFQNHDGVLTPRQTRSIEVLLDAGKKFDKQTAAAMVRMNGFMAKPWLDFFDHKGVVKTSDVVAMTSRLKIHSTTKAVLSSIAAAQAIDSLPFPPFSVHAP